MKILGNRLLVSKVDEEKKEGFQTVDIQDNFVFKGRVEKLPYSNLEEWNFNGQIIKYRDIVLFAKYSPDTQEIEHDGQKMKIIKVDDVLAIL